EVLNDSVRKTDYAARYGGEEFIVILTETHLPQAEELAERLRNDISEHSTPVAGSKELNITVSVGIASYPEHAQTWEDLLKAADSAMYAAKHAGRNRVRVAENTI
ncbi:MAG: GGDEF domain-containing protein, partial [Gammaproteobacteria bacterium]|nr:GGDEF domain-containing protein [Gammaproteobacteria bacterium]